MNLITGETTNLTHTPNDWDEHAHYSPDGKYIAWMSATGLGINITSISNYAWEEQLITELWLMNSNGTDEQRLTYFNDDGYAESLGTKRAIVSDMTWSPDSKKLAILVALPDSPEKSSIFLVELR
jgi:Tol biopolymer transport system component